MFLHDQIVAVTIGSIWNFQNVEIVFEFQNSASLHVRLGFAGEKGEAVLSMSKTMNWPDKAPVTLRVFNFKITASEWS